jgi:transcription antitermination factor NusG
MSTSTMRHAQLGLMAEPAFDANAGLARYAEPHWYVVYTCANHEKRVAEQLGQRSVEHFLPLYATVRRWKDRKVHLQIPLFPGYVFVRMSLFDRLKVLQTPSVACLVGISGQPSALPDEEIEALKQCSARGIAIEPYPYLSTGRRVRIVAGALCGYEGILVRRKGHHRVVLSINLVKQSAAIEVDASMLVPV